MDLEVPCRDTDPVDNAGMEANVEPLAFTIDFGDSENLEEKAKKFERFAQRSSQRKVKSPRQDKTADKDFEGTNIENTKDNEDAEDKQRAKVFHRDKSILARTGWTNQKLREQNVYTRSANRVERLDIQDITDEKDDKQEVNDDVSSQTGTYTMEEEEELNQVKDLQFNQE